jgi:hypothetical protein
VPVTARFAEADEVLPRSSPRAADAALVALVGTNTAVARARLPLGALVPARAGGRRSRSTPGRRPAARAPARERGFNQAECSRAVACALDAGDAAGLALPRRASRPARCTGRAAGQRGRRLPRGPARTGEGPRIGLADDLITTGATCRQRRLHCAAPAGT